MTDYHVGLWIGLISMSRCVDVMCVRRSDAVFAADNGRRTITGPVQSQDLRRVDQAIVQVRDQEGNVVTQGVTNQAGEFTVTVPEEGTYSVSAVQDTYKSEYVVVKIGVERAAPVTLTLSVTQEIALEIVSPLPAIQYKASSETYQLSRKDIEALPKGNNNDVSEVLLTVPSVVYGALKQTHIRQDHANQQYRIDGIPIPDTVSGAFADIVPPRAWERADIILGGMEAQYGNKTASRAISRARAARNRDSAPCKSSADPMKR